MSVTNIRSVVQSALAPNSRGVVNVTQDEVRAIFKAATDSRGVVSRDEKRELAATWQRLSGMAGVEISASAREQFAALSARFELGGTVSPAPAVDETPEPVTSPLPPALVAEILAELRPDLSEDSELPYYPDEWEAYFAGALKRHGLRADDETLEYMVKRFEIPTMIARRVVSAFREEDPRPSAREAFDRQVERYRQKGYALTADDAEVLFEGLRPTILAWHIQDGVARFREEEGYGYDPDGPSEWRPIFKDALSDLGLPVSSAAIEALRKQFEIPAVVVTNIVDWAGPYVIGSREAFDDLVKDRGFGLTAKEKNALYKELRPVLDSLLARERRRRDGLRAMEERDNEIRAWLRATGYPTAATFSGEELYQAFREHAQFVRLDTAVASLIRTGFFDPPRRDGVQPVSVPHLSPVAVSTPNQPQVVDVPRMNVLLGGGSIDPWIARVDREFNARLRPR